MLSPDTQVENETEAQESAVIDDVLELGELTDTQGGPGLVSDYLGGWQR